MFCLDEDQDGGGSCELDGDTGIDPCDPIRRGLGVHESAEGGARPRPQCGRERQARPGSGAAPGAREVQTTLVGGRSPGRKCAQKP